MFRILLLSTLCVACLQLKDWVSHIVEDWKLKSIIPYHFTALIPTKGLDLTIAFAFLNKLPPKIVEKLLDVFAFSLATMFNKASLFFPTVDMKTFSS